MVKKKRFRLSDHEAALLGFKPKGKTKTGGNFRYMLNEKQEQQLKESRKQTIKNAPLSIKGTSTLYDKNGDVIIEWVKTDKNKEKQFNQLKEAINELKKSIKPAPKTPIPTHESNSNLLNLYTLTDYHLGMMSWDEETGDNWDIKIAEETLVKFFQCSILQSPMAETCIFANIGDFLHWDGLEAVTPASKHVLDADTRYTKLVRVAIRVIKRVISMLLEKYQKVIVIMAEGNHDLASSVWLRELLNDYYDKDNRVFIDTTAFPYYCVNFGTNFIGFHHGHKANLNRIESVMIGKYKKEFGNSEKVYIHTGHLHHEIKKETNLSLIEQHRTLASKDSYASRGGWDSGRDSKVITYHKKFGEVGRNTVNIDMLK